MFVRRNEKLEDSPRRSGGTRAEVVHMDEQCWWNRHELIGKFNVGVVFVRVD